MKFTNYNLLLISSALLVTLSLTHYVRADDVLTKKASETTAATFHAESDRHDANCPVVAVDSCKSRLDTAVKSASGMAKSIVDEHKPIKKEPVVEQTTSCDAPIKPTVSKIIATETAAPDCECSVEPVKIPVEKKEDIKKPEMPCMMPVITISMAPCGSHMPISPMSVMPAKAQLKCLRRYLRKQRKLLAKKLHLSTEKFREQSKVKPSFSRRTTKRNVEAVKASADEECHDNEVSQKEVKTKESVLESAAEKKAVVKSGAVEAKAAAVESKAGAVDSKSSSSMSSSSSSSMMGVATRTSTVNINGRMVKTEYRKEMRNGETVEVYRLTKDGQVSTTVIKDGKQISFTVTDEKGTPLPESSGIKADEKIVAAIKANSPGPVDSGDVKRAKASIKADAVKKATNDDVDD